MKRHPSLVPLSREHHPALLLAQLLKKNAPVYRGMPSIADEKASYAVALFQRDLKAHFMKEEAMLQKIAGHYPEISGLVKEIEQEHRDLTSAFMAVQSSADLVNDLDALGRKLEQHIRREERVLFPLIEKICPPEMMEEIGALLK